MTKVKILILCIFLASCSPIRVIVDYDDKADFTKYRTYNYFEDMNTGLSELDTNRFLDAMDATLKSKGLELSSAPDFLINISSSEFQPNQNNNVGVGFGSTGRNVGGGISVGIPIGKSNINRQIVVSFVDHRKDQVFWEILTESAYNQNIKPEQREAKLKAIVEKALAEYPPEDKE